MSEVISSCSNGGKNSNYPINSDLWWFGFDCGHYDDSNDYDLAIEYFPHLKEHLLWTKEIEGRYPIGKEIRTLEYVEKECKKLAEQLKIYDDNKSKGCEE